MFKVGPDQASAKPPTGAKSDERSHLIDSPGVSTRFACRVVGLARSTFASPHPDQTGQDPDAGLRTWLCVYAKQHPRWGYRRAHHDARAEGWVVNHKKTQRLWREEGLRVPQRRRRKRIGSSTAADQVTAHGPDDMWGIDFQFDRVEDGQALNWRSTHLHPQEQQVLRRPPEPAPPARK
jgi:transposase InsO family protein